MDAGDTGQRLDHYDRDSLLFGPRRNAELDLEEVRRYGVDSVGDPDFVSVYGMAPDAWYARGIRMLGRTAVECTRDALARAIADDVADVVTAGVARFHGSPLVVDLFAGSGNTLFWLQRQIPSSVGLGFELDPGVYALTSRNLATISSPLELRHVDYLEGLGALPQPDGLVVVFVAPPWGTALDPVRGLDLGATTPPVASVLEAVDSHLPSTPLLLAVQVSEQVDPASLAEVASRFEWSALRRYELDPAVPAHGVLLGTRGWAPPHGVPVFWE